MEIDLDEDPLGAPAYHPTVLPNVWLYGFGTGMGGANTLIAFGVWTTKSSVDRLIRGRPPHSGSFTTSDRRRLPPMLLGWSSLPD